MIQEDLVAERIAIDSYREMIGYLSATDPPPGACWRGILAVEEEHADDLVKSSRTPGRLRLLCIDDWETREP